MFLSDFLPSGQTSILPASALLSSSSKGHSLRLMVRIYVAQPTMAKGQRDKGHLADFPSQPRARATAIVTRGPTCGELALRTDIEWSAGQAFRPRGKYYELSSMKISTFPLSFHSDLANCAIDSIYDRVEKRHCCTFRPPQNWGLVISFVHKEVSGPPPYTLTRTL